MIVADAPDPPDTSDANDASDESDESDANDDVVEVALTDSIDLHTFRPRDCADVVEEYVRAAQEAGMTSVRIIHGKGVGTLRRIVHGVLENHPAVASFRLGDERSGQWGATLVELRRRP